jgi:hypothetical protein
VPVLVGRVDQDREVEAVVLLVVDERYVLVAAEDVEEEDVLLFVSIDQLPDPGSIRLAAASPGYAAEHDEDRALVVRGADFVTLGIEVDQTGEFVAHEAALLPCGGVGQEQNSQSR